MSTPPIASRHHLAVEALALRGDETVLEIGCGQGVATRLVLERLTSGHITAIDRSEKMIARLEPLTGGKLSAIAGAFEDVDFKGRQFDAIFAVNVELDLRLGDRWPGMVRDRLAESGLFVLAFEAPPGSGKGEAFARSATGKLERGGFTVSHRSTGHVSVLSARSLLEISAHDG